MLTPVAFQRSGVTAFKTVIALVIASSLLTIAAVMAIDRLNIFDGFDLFGSETVDRSGPTMLERIRTLEEFTAAEGNFTQDVDIENDTKFVPGFVSGQRVVAIVTGSVGATVDFSRLDGDSVTVEEDSSTIRITLPQPTLSGAEIDEQSVRIVSRERGFADRVEDFFAENPTDDSPVFRTAKARIDKAADESELVERARANTEQWLRTFLAAAGFETVGITWQ